MRSVCSCWGRRRPYPPSHAAPPALQERQAEQRQREREEAEKAARTPRPVWLPPLVIHPDLSPCLAEPLGLGPAAEPSPAAGAAGAPAAQHAAAPGGEVELGALHGSSWLRQQQQAQQAQQQAQQQGSQHGGELGGTQSGGGAPDTLRPPPAGTTVVMVLPGRVAFGSAAIEPRD